MRYQNMEGSNTLDASHPDPQPMSPEVIKVELAEGEEGGGGPSHRGQNSGPQVSAPSPVPPLPQNAASAPSKLIRRFSEQVSHGTLLFGMGWVKSRKQ
jgi:hypothetical protein